MDNTENTNENLSDAVKALSLEIEKIKERNKRVELDKAWETSMTRKVSIIILTYIVMVLVMDALKMESPLINAIIPTLGFTLSTFSMSLIKIFWLKKR